MYRKGAHLVLKAMKRVIEKNKDATLTIVGKGYMRPFLNLISDALEISDNVIIKGMVCKNKLIKLYQKSNAFVIPSLFGEAFGIVVLEAMASMTPVVAFERGGIKEIIVNKRNGLFAKDPDDLAEKIVYILNNKKEATRIALNALEDLKRYDWKNIVKEIEKVYLDN